MRTILFALATLAALSGCNQKSNIKKAVVENLIDPDSAKFGDITVNDRGDLACVTINARNRMGGYTGDSQMLMAKLDSGEWGKVNDSDEQSHETCVGIMNQLKSDE